MNPTRRFTVFARPSADGYTPEFIVMDGNVATSTRAADGTFYGAMFKTFGEAVADAERREAAASDVREMNTFERAEADYTAARS